MPNPLNVPITPPRVAFIDSRTGNVSREWYMFFLSLFSLVGGSSVSLNDLQKGPPAASIDEINAAIKRATENLTPVSGASELRADLDDVRQELQTMPRQELRADLDDVRQELQTMPRQELGTLAALQQDNVPWLKFDTTPSGFPTGAAANGTLYWDNADGIKTLNLVMEDSGDVIQQIGEETYYRIKADAAITDGQVVMFTGTVGASGALKGAPATGLTATQNEHIMGIATQDIALNGWGYVTWFGLVRGLDTSGGAEAWVDGQVLYYNPAVPGGLTKTVPTAPNPKVIVASVVHAAATNGSLFVRPTFGSVLGGTDSNVEITGLANNDVLVYDSVDQRWENKAPTAARDALGLGAGDPANGQLLIGNGTDFTTANLTAGANITITNAAGYINIAATTATIGSTGSVPLAKITPGGTDGSLSFIDGLIIGFLSPT